MHNNKQKNSETKRKRIALALGYYDYWINVGIADFARKHHWILDNLSLHGQYPSSQLYDGIICLLNCSATPALIDFVSNSSVPAVDLVNEFQTIQLARVVYDNFAIGVLAANHFIERGFENFIYYQVNDAIVELDRKSGFQQRIEEKGLNFILFDLFRSGIDYSKRENRIEWLKTKLQQQVFPVAAMAQCDANTQEILMACEEIGIIVPDQLAAVGVDNDIITSELGIIPLSSVDDNRELLGFSAAQMLQTLMDGLPPPVEPVKIPPKGIVIRESSDILAVANPKAARALRFIWKNYKSDIDSSTVAKTIGLSRRGLFTMFEKYLHRSVSQEITKCRINEAKRLLRETDMTVAEIASMSGFKHGEHIARIFRESLNMKPSEYRKLHR
jgi:LacI family transcriptional regulator